METHTNSIVCPKNEMRYHLKIIKYLSIFSNDVRLVIKRKLICVIEDVNNNEHSTEECSLKIAADAMIDEGVKNKIVERKNRWNRNDASNYMSMCNIIKIEHKKRWEKIKHTFLKIFIKLKTKLTMKFQEFANYEQPCILL